MNRAALLRSARLAVLGWGLFACEGSPGSAADAGGGRTRTPGSAPACVGGAAPFIPVLVQAAEGSTTAWRGPATVPVRLVERGIGVPPSGTSSDYSHADQVAWLRLGAPGGDGGAAVGDAAGAGDERATAATADAEVPAFIVGPRALADLPAEDGDEFVLRVQYPPPAPLYLGSYEVQLEQGDRVLLFHEDGAVAESVVQAGFARTSGTTVCEDDLGCAMSYHTELQVTVPGGAAATLAPGQTATIGDYQVSHGNTESQIRQQPNTCNDILFDATYSQFTAVLLPEAE